MKNKKTTQEKNSSDNIFPDSAQLMEEFKSLFLRSEDKSMLLYALLDDDQAETSIRGLAKSISKICEFFSVIKLRVRGEFGGFDAVKYCPDKLLKEIEGFDVAVSELIEVIEHIKQLVLEREELASHSSEEDNTPTKTK